VKSFKHPATIVAALALFVALGSGGAIAGGLSSSSTGAAKALSRTIYLNKVVKVAAGTDPASAASVTLAKYGPFTITGKCWAAGLYGTLTAAGTFIQTTQDGAMFGGNGPAGVPSTRLTVAAGAVEVAELATPHTSYLSGGEPWAAVSADGKTVINVTSNSGVWLRGPNGPACSFSGYMVKVAGP
jgi:hypothetical protein